jgi:hypothetical protein
MLFLKHTDMCVFDGEAKSEEAIYETHPNDEVRLNQRITNLCKN